jgi:hypothetical protein
LIATRAWLACRASLHEGGYHYATSCGGEGADGAPTFLHTGFPPYSRALLGYYYSARYHICLSIACVWAMTAAIDARRSKIPPPGQAGAPLSRHAVALGGREVDSSRFFVRFARANLGCFALIRTIGERERAGGPPSVKSARLLPRGHIANVADSSSISTRADNRPFGPAAADVKRATTCMAGKAARMSDNPRIHVAR